MYHGRISELAYHGVQAPTSTVTAGGSSAAKGRQRNLAHQLHRLCSRSIDLEQTNLAPCCHRCPARAIEGAHKTKLHSAAPPARLAQRMIAQSGMSHNRSQNGEGRKR